MRLADNVIGCSTNAQLALSAFAKSIQGVQKFGDTDDFWVVLQEHEILFELWRAITDRQIHILKKRKNEIEK